MKKIFKNIQVELNEILDIWHRANTSLYEAENKEGTWEEDPEDSDFDRAIHEEYRKEIIIENKEILNTEITMDDIKAPMTFPIVKIKQSVIDYLQEYRPELAEEYVNQLFIVLGDLAQQPGHMIIVNMSTGKIIPAIHTDDLILCKPDEV